MKKKNFILGASALLCLSALTPLALHATNNLTNFVQGESKDYSLAITPATLKINEAGNKGTIQTSLNNELALNLSRVSDKTDYLRLEAYGFISNDTSFPPAFLVSKPSPRRLKRRMPDAISPSIMATRWAY